MGNCSCDEAGRGIGITFAFELAFPMYVVRAEDVLRMTAVEPHERLMEQGVLVDFIDPRSGLAVFVSHQWASRQHPDPTFQQFAVLQEVVRHALDGTLRLEVDVFTNFTQLVTPRINASELRAIRDDSYVWYDFFGVPQMASLMLGLSPGGASADMEKAISSIHAYVERSRFFIILAPELQHGDDAAKAINYGSWKARGWCRAERMAANLNRNRPPMLLADRGEMLFEIGTYEHLIDPVGEGQFSDAADRVKLRGIFETLLTMRLSDLDRSGQVEDYRLLKSRVPSMLRGLPIVSSGPAAALVAPEEGGNVAARFLAMYAFSKTAVAELPQADMDLALLRAAAAGNARVLQALLDNRANIESGEKTHNSEFFILPGMRPLHHAAWNGHIAATGALLERGAKLNAQESRGGNYPLHFSASNSCPDASGVLIQHAANLEAKNAESNTALGIAAMFGRVANVRKLLAAGARCGGTQLRLVTMMGGGAEVVDVLLEARCSPSGRFQLHWNSGLTVYIRAKALPHRLWGTGGLLAAYFHHLANATPLHLAAMTGHAAEARALLRGGAPPEARNEAGATAADLAAIFGIPPHQHRSFGALVLEAEGVFVDIIDMEGITERL